MNDEELTGFYDVYGHLPQKYNRKFLYVERLNSSEHFPATRTLTKDTGERPKKAVLNGMKTMIVLLYVGSLAGVYIQAADIIPGLPDIWAGGFTIALLIIANAMLWRHMSGLLAQMVKDRADYAARLAQMQQEHQAARDKQQEAMLRMVEANKESIKEVLSHLKTWNK